VSGYYLDKTKVEHACGRCGHKWKVLKRRIEWRTNAGFKLLCNACEKRQSAARHQKMASHLIIQANEIDARRAAKRAQAQKGKAAS